MSKIVVISKFSKLLTKKELIQILKLKKTFWPFNLKSQMFFLKKIIINLILIIFCM